MLVLASEFGNHDMYKSGQLQKSDGSASGLAVQLQLLTVAEMFVEDAVEEILSSVPLGRDGTSQPSSAPEPKRQWDGNNKCLLTLSALLHQLLQIRHIHTKVICFTCYFTLDHCIFLPGSGLVCLWSSWVLVVKLVF